MKRFPRARGDVPAGARKRQGEEGFSPRTRGCSEGRERFYLSSFVFPAHAGMFRRDGISRTGGSSFPRARGDVPENSIVCQVQKRFSPRTRGCSFSASSAP